MAPLQPESLFCKLDTAPADEVFALMGDFAADTHPDKVSLGAGVYRDNEAKSWRLPAVKKAEQLLLDDPTLDHEYLPIPGYAPFYNMARDLIFGTGESSIPKERIASLQTISGTGANHIGARFLADHLPKLSDPNAKRTIWISDPTWANHHLIWNLVSSGTSGSPIQVKTYPYYHEPTRSLNFEGMMKELEAHAVAGDVVLLHACAHNPTGIDPTRAQWLRIADLCESRSLFPFFDSAYQGFASGDLDNDAWPIREFAKRGMELCVAQSFSKNLGLYGQRTGAFHLVCRNAEATVCARSQVVELQRGEISTPPSYGPRLAAKILSDPALVEMWKEDLITMSSRIKSMRRALYDELQRLQTPGTWEHIINQIGMFSYTGLTKEQVRLLREYHIYLLDSGRISIAGLNTSNLKYVAEAIDSVVRKTTKTSNGSNGSNGH
ncbi:aspartate aminotransferase, putative [Trichophyton verrucosum HKI 0517]|uniref:aspartate transaminase n=1 Tax=Trichophyton verrucosum (strain HKI 0517) TaxID=663202 RepID=D4DGI1_TRIVH|nr:aspartate aminotransferase, putative [Trichophyton verrucosum HKI 0517]EFE39011.1 aspartate aminotransferase, putative [Trichophyton verrucosum HKI 0517]